MIVPKQYLPYLYDFLSKQLGLNLTVHNPPHEDEFARCVWGDRLMTVRPLTPGADGEQVEVWCGNPDILHKLEDVWAHHFAYLATQVEGLIDDDAHKPGNEGKIR